MAITHEKISHRLPGSVKPKHYDLAVLTDLEGSSFHGLVKIKLDIVHATSTITMHSSGLEWSNVLLQSDAFLGDVEPSTTFDEELQRATLTLPEALKGGSTATVQIHFYSKLSENNRGYYKATWKHDDTSEPYAGTHFEATSARRAFPCWDEPALKATFSTTLISRKNTVSISNMNVRSQTTATLDDMRLTQLLAKALPDKSSVDQFEVVHFETTPLMSTYLVAYANGPFAYKEGTYHSPISNRERPLRVYATPDLVDQCQFAVHLAAKAVPLLETLFDVEYPLPKLDILALHDFDIGAMENWGLITGRTDCLLLSSTDSNISVQKNVADTIVHEISHMWFGDITTMEWWDNLYLKEGYATLMGAVVVDKLHPEWKVKSDFINWNLSRALNLDARPSSHPIEVACPDAGQIMQIFDSLSYSKAASVLRMLLHFVGEERFMKGTSLYLKAHLYGNTISADLWKGLSEATGIDVENMMDTWVSKIGFPVLTVTEEPGGIRVRQDRYLESGPASADDNQTIWTVPLNVVSAAGAVDASALLSTREAFFALDTSKPFKLNAGTTGVYRVLYTAERTLSIARASTQKGSIFSSDDRAGLVADALALAKSGHAPLGAALGLVGAFKGEMDFSLWDSIASAIALMVSTWWDDERASGLLNAFQRAAFGPLVKKLGYTPAANEAPDTRQLRSRAISRALAAGEHAVVEGLTERFVAYMRSPEDAGVPADLLNSVFTAGVKHGGRAEWEFAKKTYETHTVPAIQGAGLQSMVATRDPSLISETIRYGLLEARDQDMVSFVHGLAANHAARRALMEAFMEHFNEIYKRFDTSNTWRSILVAPFQSLSSTEDRERIAAFFKDKDTSRYDKALAQALDAISARTAWRVRSTAELLEWLEKWQTEENAGAV